MDENIFPGITGSSIYVGLNADWISIKEAVGLINTNFRKHQWQEAIVIEINVNDEDKDFVLKKISELESINQQDGIEYWKLITLVNIRKSEKDITDKLIEIAQQWAKFDYPEEWRSFIYYLPNENTGNQNDIYLNFINYLLKK